MKPPKPLQPKEEAKVPEVIKPVEEEKFPEKIPVPLKETVAIVEKEEPLPNFKSALTEFIGEVEKDYL